MLFLICLLITLHNYSCYAIKSEASENVYIDTLIQRYLSEEIFLWESIYSNSSGRSQNTVNYIINRIRSTHYDILNDPYLEYVMGEVYMGKFIKYVDFYNIQNYAEEYQQLILTKQQSETYMTSEMTFNVYNYIAGDTLFEKINKVLNGKCSSPLAD